MITITHMLLGVATYHAVDRHRLSVRERNALLAGSVTGSLIPDIDVLVKHTELGQTYYQMWHRGITHSIFIAPLWALFIFAMVLLLFRVKHQRYFWIPLIAVLTHIITDYFNPWGTGLLEPFSNARYSLGYINYADPLIPAMICAGILLLVLLRQRGKTGIFRAVWSFIAIHIAVQSLMGVWIYNAEIGKYDKVMLSASTSPWQFYIVGQKGSTFELSSGTPWNRVHNETIHSLAISPELLQLDKRAEILNTWAPAVVLEDKGDHYVLYDPRFYRNGTSFLSEFIEKP